MTTWWNGAEALAQIKAAALAGVVAATEGVITDGSRRIAEPPKTGRIYKRKGVEHQASAPGESPASDLGALLGSAQALYPPSSDPLVIRGIANWSMDYAAYLELGTEIMEPRPFARPALDAVAPTLAPDIALRVTSALQLSRAVNASLGR